MLLLIKEWFFCYLFTSVEKMYACIYSQQLLLEVHHSEQQAGRERVCVFLFSLAT